MKRMIPLFFRTAAVSAALVSAGLAPTAASAADYPPAGDFARGAKVWADTCIRCHNLRDPKELRDDQWISTIHHMRVRSGITGQEMRDILTFLQASNSPAARTAPVVAEIPTSTSAAAAADGEAIFSQTCIACHGADGKGVLPGVPDFTRPGGRLAKSDEALLNSIRNGYQSPGSPMAMPPKGGNSALSEADLRAVLGYIRKTFGR
ncbi:c-type cytochrome [Thiohalobacter sp. IOR34]|uniref:c-type cytochrome n=1 Tax=Thiohalobacter sp. IOR34 TaxID=3057176 RepID=UPI0025B11C85|nr:cytochrome c [Thiohalobacter sp. IOR34]WJW74274.1 c-type cytochrome [Thiohalobacter sp. IOR34]